MAKNNGSTTETPRVISVSVLVQEKWRTFPIAQGSGSDPPQVMVRYSNGLRAHVLTGPNRELGCECIDSRILEWRKRKPRNGALTPLLPLKPSDYNGNGAGNGHA